MGRMASKYSQLFQQGSDAEDGYPFYFEESPEKLRDKYFKMTTPGEEKLDLAAEKWNMVLDAVDAASVFIPVGVAKRALLFDDLAVHLDDLTRFGEKAQVLAKQKGITYDELLTAYKKAPNEPEFRELSSTLDRMRQDPKFSGAPYKKGGSADAKEVGELRGRMEKQHGDLAIGQQQTLPPQQFTKAGKPITGEKSYLRPGGAVKEVPYDPALTVAELWGKGNKGGSTGHLGANDYREVFDMIPAEAAKVMSGIPNEEALKNMGRQQLFRVKGVGGKPDIIFHRITRPNKVTGVEEITHQMWQTPQAYMKRIYNNPSLGTATKIENMPILTGRGALITPDGKTIGHPFGELLQTPATLQENFIGPNRRFRLQIRG